MGVAGSVGMVRLVARDQNLRRA